ncbi:uncharacterized protein LACBIDRAFT_317390 [Laccaria bicolor S238N-H82]|uniref:Predicted protein n=1 Tax=Laccaria bicolor (strain S238N-H82 / ATCC MYA-4686) TaxID=486041 RepID=B0D530_LACBS|nr:uncharacterized protein LACBIDRAFT_317390 [Laccaria bicolor S238N-H82]EDR10663.1 predicted protein [Laccaria bicolor S238N-H82]|eukprot:XP_001879113.1 predicted protein [Laccaria bicolor S238N-H82]
MTTRSHRSWGGKDCQAWQPPYRTQLMLWYYILGVSCNRHPRLPSCLPILHLPLAPCKSLAGFTPASITGALVAVRFWSLITPFRNGGWDVTWALKGGGRQAWLALLDWWWEHDESLETGAGGDMLID